MTKKKSHYNKNLKDYARKLRSDGTSGEAKLWSEVLRAKQFYGLQFNRQFAIENYIVDFICRKLKLIIEIDGGSHQYMTKPDEIRDKTLSELGYKVIRVYEEDVLHDINNVIRTIEAYLPAEILNNQSPHPPLLWGRKNEEVSALHKRGSLDEAIPLGKGD